MSLRGPGLSIYTTRPKAEFDGMDGMVGLGWDGWDGWDGVSKVSFNVLHTLWVYR